MTDPFKAVSEPVRREDAKYVTDLTDKDVYFNQMDQRGRVCKYKMESGVPVKVADLGDIREFFNQALGRAALMTPDDLENMDLSGVTHLELAAMKMAAYAGAGDLKATQEMFDRLMGKAKQVSESTNLSLTIDDILKGVKVKGGTIDV